MRTPILALRYISDSLFGAQLMIVLYVFFFLTLAVWITNLIVGSRNRRFNRAKSAASAGVGTAFSEEESVSAVSEGEYEERDEEEIAAVVEEDGKEFRIGYAKSFTAKLIQAGEETKSFYVELKNEALSYGKINSRTSWDYDSLNFGRKPILKFGIRGRTLYVYFALDIKDFKGTKYKVELCEYKKYESVPCMYRIINAQRCELTKEIIAKVAEKNGLVKIDRQNVEYRFPYEDNDALVNKGLIKEVKKQIL